MNRLLLNFFNPMTEQKPKIHELNARRMLCPMPVIRTQDKIKTLSSGEILRVICTDPGVKADITSGGHLIHGLLAFALSLG